MRPAISEFNMEGNHKIIVYTVAAACILGIVLVGALVLTSRTSDEGFSELYFENSDTLPSIIKAGDKVDFAFTTVSHENEPKDYDYRISYDGNYIGSGSFLLGAASDISAPNGNYSKRKITINASLVLNNSSSVLFKDPVVTRSRMRYNAALGTIISSQDPDFDRMDLVTSPNGYSLISRGNNDSAKQIDVSMPGKFILPLRLPISDIYDNIGLLIFDPKRVESYNSSSCSIIPEGNLSGIKSSNPEILSNLGYTIRREDWNVINDNGDINIHSLRSDTSYRYAFKKISVKVSSSQAEVHRIEDAEELTAQSDLAGSNFWILVKDDPNKVQDV
jgi:hypothetical protein